MAISKGKTHPPLVRYLNWQGETIDELSSESFPDDAAFYAETRRLRIEYELAGMGGCVWSQRPKPGWND